MGQGMCGLAIAMIFFFVGFAAVLIGTGLPFWQTEQGLDIGLFYECQNWSCWESEFTEETQYIIVSLILLGILFLTVSVGCAICVCVQRCKGERIISFVPGCTCMLVVIGDTFILTGAIIYCANLYDDRGELTLDLSPALVMSGSLVCGISSYFLQRSVNEVNCKIQALEQLPNLNQEPPNLQPNPRHNHLAAQQGHTQQRHQKQQQQRKLQQELLQSPMQQQVQEQQRQQQQQHESASFGLNGQSLKPQFPYRKYSIPGDPAPTPNSLTYDQEIFSIESLLKPPAVYEPQSYARLDPAYPFPS